ncbi:unnamed protein product, partial [Rotaria sordida]
HTSNAYRIQGGTGGKSYISVMFCGSAVGVLLPPFVIYKSKRLLDEWCIGGPSDTGYDCSKKIILCLPSNSTHILQPLDIVFFNSLKIQWKNILKYEYTRTHFKTISKSQFPSLLKQMWTLDPIRTQTNVVKSFITAGIFPFNPNSIDRTRILKNKANADKHISSVPTNSANDNQTKITINIPYSHQATTSSFTYSHQAPTSSFISSRQATTSSFTSSHQAIATLDRIIEETQSINNDIEDLDNDEDEEYCPPESTSTSSTSVSSDKQQKSRSNKILITKDHQSILLQQEKKRKRKSSTIIGFNTSEDDDNENLDLSMSTSQQSFKTKYELQPKKSLPSKHHQTMSSEEQKKRMKLAFKTVGFDTSDEDDVVPNSSTSNPQKSLQAITDAIQTVFSTPPDKTPKQRSKRTVLNRSNGQIITEKIVIEQLEERKNKQRSKQSRSNNRTTNEKKRKKQGKNGMINENLIT